ncbi:MAG: sodium:solute symporter [Melioribacteraceae bacterium]|jgi:SSS family transporter|nr:sodium:solute symporter [Melioribacteraceae bacterium]
MKGSVLDYSIIGLYLIGIAIFGIISGGKQKNVKDYFLGSKNVPWWAVCFSIVAAETSTLTFISIPGLAYISNLNFLQVTIGYLIGRIIVAFVFLPAYAKGELKTAYNYLEIRFGGKTRSFASVVFLFTRIAADGVRLFATAIPLKLMIDISYPQAIILVAVVALIYTYTGGVKGIIWVDVVQMVTYLGGAIIAAIFLLNLIPGGWNSVVDTANLSGKFSIINFGFENGISGFFNQPYTLIGGLLGGAFLSMASHGTDQLIVQRLLTVKDLKSGQKAIIGSGIIVIIQFALFMLVGIMLYTYYGVLEVKSDTIFPMFIIEVMPSGIFGIIIAGLFAASLSTVAGSISSLSSSTMMDLFLPLFRKELDEVSKLKISRIFSVMWTLLLIFTALFFLNTSQTVVELALSIASFTYGGLLGTFLLGILVKRARQEDALAGFVAGIFIMITVISLKFVAWTWFTFIGVCATLLIGGFLSLLSKSENNT